MRLIETLAIELSQLTHAPDDDIWLYTLAKHGDDVRLHGVDTWRLLKHVERASRHPDATIWSWLYDIDEQTCYIELYGKGHWYSASVSSIDDEILVDIANDNHINAAMTHEYVDLKPMMYKNKELGKSDYLKRTGR